MKKALFLVLFFTITKIHAQQRITDFQSENRDISSSPSDFVEFNGKIFFGASTNNFGREIWVSNGNTDEAYLLKDIYPSNNSSISQSFSETSVILGNTLFFIATDGSSDGEIWKTDGTSEGTEKVTNFLNYKVSKLTTAGDKLFFLIQKENTLQVWVSDGTEAGTQIAKDGLSIWNSPTFQGSCNNTFIFTFQPYGSNDSKVWRSDGTSTGTFPITEEIDGNGASLGGTSGLTQYIEFGNELFFVSRRHLYKTDGTLNNTVRIANMHDASTRLVNYADVVEINGKLFFSFFELDENRLSIWQSDGTESGTSIIYDQSNHKYFMPSNLLGKKNNLLFTGANENGETSLIKMDLNDFSITHLQEIPPCDREPFFFSKSTDLCILQHINNEFVFCSSPILFWKKRGWVTGLTKETTRSLEKLNHASEVFHFNNSIYFSKYSDEIGSELWKSDGTEGGTILVENINKSKYGINKDRLISLNSNLVFTVGNGSSNLGIWKYSDTNTSLLKATNSEPNNSKITSFTKYNNEIYFTGFDKFHGYELWKISNNETETGMVHDIMDGKASSSPKHLTVHNNSLYFTVRKENQYFLFMINGSNLEPITSLGTDQFGNPARMLEMNSSGDYLYYIVDDAGEDLWIHDKTGGRKSKDFTTCQKLTDVNGKLFFTASETYDGEDELWITDGTEPGTKLLKKFEHVRNSAPKELINFNGTLFFTLHTEKHGREIWKSDGTESGTKQLIDINSGSQSSIRDANFCIVNNTLFFRANNGENGFELWKTDGTEAGTSIVKDINSGIDGSFPVELVAVDNLLYFQAYHPDHGAELWKSDGTEEGTVLAVDILSGNESSFPTQITPIGDNIFFMAESVNFGRQIWKLNKKTATALYRSLYSEADVFAYPNPCVDYIYFNTKNIEEEIQIYNSRGQQVYIDTVRNNSINVSHLPAGIYLLKCKIGNQHFIKKIVKK